MPVHTREWGWRRCSAIEALRNKYAVKKFTMAGNDDLFRQIYLLDAKGQMPNPVAPPAVQSRTDDEGATPAPDGRAEAGRALTMPDRPPVDFGERPGAASETQLRR